MFVRVSNLNLVLKLGIWCALKLVKVSKRGVDSYCMTYGGNVGSKINRSECYNVNYLGAYCINDILAGYNRYNDIDNTEYAVTTEVCTKDIEQCESFKKYQAKGSRSQCVRKIVADAEWEGSFLTSEEKLNDIIKNNPKKQQ